MNNEQQIKILCRNVRYLRLKYGLSQRSMARLLGIGVTSLRMLEGGQLPPRLPARVLRRYAQIFQISIDAALSSSLETP